MDIQTRADAGFAVRRQQQRAFWLRQLHQWHWISAGLSLVGLLLFSVTGITLNHAGQIEAHARTVSVQTKLPTAQLRELVAIAPAQPARLPASVAGWLASELGARLHVMQPEWSRDEVYLDLPQPGADGWLSIQFADGAIEFEHTDRGWISWANDLHKGRHTGSAWRWFIDAFAAACLIFALTGLLLLGLHARRRPATWPLVTLGALIPLLLLLLAVH